MKEVTEKWLRAAADDLRVIDKISSDEYLTHMVAFHSQQCIEKSLKVVMEEFEIGSVKNPQPGEAVWMVGERL